MELEAAMIYATALYGAASDLGHVREVREEITEISKILREEEHFSKILTDPGVPREQKKSMLKNIFEGRVHDEVLHFLWILVDKGRVPGLHHMVEQYCRMDDEKNLVSDGVICSAVELSKEQMKRFQEEAGKLLGKKVKLENKLDPRLLGGIRLYVDGKLLDASLATRLETLSDRIRNS